MTPLLSVRDLNVHTTTGRTLVREVNFDLHQGQTLGIVGESGSGKTMTARAVAQVLADNVRAQGRISFDGVDLLGLPERRLRALRGTRLSMVLQDPFTALNPLQTIGAHLRESLPNAARGDRGEIARRLREVGLDPDTVAGKYPFQLSGGMRQRVAIAAALAGDPDLLIADEPTTALDVTTQADVLALLRRLRDERGMALILITHDLRVAFSACDRILVMYAGSVLEDAPAQKLAAAPEHPYSTGLLLAEPPVSHYVADLTSIPGGVPAADTVAHVCPFAERCQWREEACTAARPALADAGGGHATACLRIDDIRPLLRDTQARLSVPATPPEPPRGKPLLSVENLVKTYRTQPLLGRARVTTAVRDVSFTITAGESLGVVGETGSGKTTIARSILGLIRPDSGSITLDGTDISDYRALGRAGRAAVRRVVQVVFQDPYASLNPSLTMGAALAEAVAVSRETGDHGARVAELLELVGLPAGYAERRPSALSGGERQRAAIARALAVRPRLLICDEPVAALDVSVQSQILEVLRGIRAALGTSLLFITHDLSVVRQMTDRVIVLRHGQIVESGTTATVLDAPEHPYTAQLVASVPEAGDAEPSAVGS
ncbi:ABC transporter ATP-binding protein [Nonomuraea bangladeshensis]|uniref:ABC transporter ATP-binding protein n=1 Tax=Nonomuraea bangladeshensis TaxID=404385 RepID=UPI0031DD54BA